MHNLRYWKTYNYKLVTCYCLQLFTAKWPLNLRLINIFSKVNLIPFYPKKLTRKQEKILKQTTDTFTAEKMILRDAFLLNTSSGNFFSFIETRKEWSSGFLYNHARFLFSCTHTGFLFYTETRNHKNVTSTGCFTFSCYFFDFFSKFLMQETLFKRHQTKLNKKWAKVKKYPVDIRELFSFFLDIDTGTNILNILSLKWLCLLSNI